MGNGAKAQQKRERNADKNAKKGSTSQTKSNEAAKNILCDICRQTFLVTTRLPQLQQHVDNKHDGRTFKDCFPKYEEGAKS